MSVLKRTSLFAIIGIIIIASFLMYLFEPWIIIPTKSSSRKLTLIKLGGSLPDRISIKHFIEDKYVCTYDLELEYPLHLQEAQRYKLPKIKEGSIEVDVELKDINENKVVLTNKYNNAYDVYKNGLLIYFDWEYIKDDSPSENKYVYFISGKSKTVYFNEAHTSKWIKVTEAPALKKIVEEEIGYTPFNYGWKKNTWVMKWEE